MGLVRWTFVDQFDSTTYQYEVNPNAGGSPTRKRNTTTHSTSAPRGKSLVFEGALEPQTFEWSGTLLDQQSLDTMNTWYTKRHQIRMTDDLGRSFYLYLTNFDVKRVRSSQHKFKHTYTASATLLDWA